MVVRGTLEVDGLPLESTSRLDCRVYGLGLRA